jgi:hypothetical protein
MRTKIISASFTRRENVLKSSENKRNAKKSEERCMIQREKPAAKGRREMDLQFRLGLKKPSQKSFPCKAICSESAADYR